jgi:hypothetical protein
VIILFQPVIKMAFINKGKHIEKEIDGVRIRVVDDGASKDRMEFLKALLEHNGYEVLVEEIVPKPPKPDEEVVPTEPKWLVGVTDIIFNPVVYIYQRRLRTLEGEHVTPDYWNQVTREAEPNYWDRSKKTS